MSRLKRIIIILIIIIIILIISIIGVIHFNKGEIVYKIDETGSDEGLYNIDTTLQYVTVRNDYYAVQTCVKKFYSYYTAIFDNGNDIDIDEDVEMLNNEEALYNMLDKEYIDYKNITQNNVSEKIDKINDSVVNINQMYVSKKNINVSVYVVQGKLREVKSGNISDFNLIIKMDALNKTFSVYLEDYINENYKNLEIGNEINMEVAENIVKNDTNIYDYSIIDDQTYVTDLLEKYKEEIIFDRESAYNHLDEEYKQKRFKDFNDFQEFAKDNVKKNINIKIAKYKETKYDNYVEYVCLDQNGNYYIFNETSTMNYGLILDTYTVNLPDFIEKYNQGNEQVKVGMNIEKVIDSINTKDYKYAYNRLNETFKNNYFNTQEDFEKYIKNNFFNYNNFEFKNITQKGSNLYTCDLNVTDLTEENTATKNITIIMQLKDNLDFEMSFSID